MMRITGSMLANNMMLNVNRSMNRLDRLMVQAEGKKISRPSDDPLIAARAMKFRNNLISNADFQSNTENGLAWMDVTSSAIDDLLKVLSLEARDTILKAANDTLDLKDRNVLVAALRGIVEQMGFSMNSQFAGRYVFSGLRTDQPPIFAQDEELGYKITQNFSLADIEQIKSLQIYTPDANNPNQALPITKDVHILKLAYRDLDMDPATGNPAGMTITAKDGTVFTVTTKSVDDTDAYDQPAAGTAGPPPTANVTYIEETGELVFNTDDVTGTRSLDMFPVDITYEKTGFAKGELNPITYFDCELQSAPAGHSLRYLLDLANSTVPPNLSYVTFTMDGQDKMEYEFSTHTTVPVNSLAKDIYTDKMYTDLLRLIEFVESVNPTTDESLREYYRELYPDISDEALQVYVETHRADENAAINNALNTRFNNMLFLIDRHVADTRKESTDLGNRGRRLELFQNRLEQDEGSLSRLMSHNEDIDAARLYTLMSQAQVVYMAALNAGVNVINTTLSNFLNF